MAGELMPYSSGQEMVPLRDRKVAKQAKRVYDEVRLKSFEAEGSIALGGKIMDGLVGLDAHRRNLSNGDPILDVMLMEIQANTIRQAKIIQDGLYQGWGG